MFSISISGHTMSYPWDGSKVEVWIRNCWGFSLRYHELRKDIMSVVSWITMLSIVMVFKRQL